jgi:hypothetical protein
MLWDLLAMLRAGTRWAAIHSVSRDDLAAIGRGVAEDARSRRWCASRVAFSARDSSHFMRVAIVFFCAAVAACAQPDQRPIVSKPAFAVADASSTPVADSQPVAKVWAPNPLPAPGDTTSRGFPTEAALLRWVHLIPPDSFPDLPKPVRDSLVSRHCQIPMPGAARANVIHGAFSAKGAMEWAVLCSVHDTSQILILNARNGVAVDSLNKSGDSRWIQGNGNNTWLFSRMIDVVPSSTLNVVPVDTTSEDALYYGAFLPKPIDHDGIDEAFLDKASTTFYFAHGHWISVSSGD